MHSQKQIRSSSIFLIELILAIFFFSLASAVCVQIFVKSHLLSQSSQQLNFAVRECGSVAELLTTADGLSHFGLQLASLYPQAEQSDFPTVTLYYDRQFCPCDSHNAIYRLTFTLTDISASFRGSTADAFNTYETTLLFEDLSSKSTIYRLDVSHHIPKEVQHEKK